LREYEKGEMVQWFTSPGQAVYRLMKSSKHFNPFFGESEN